VLVVLRRPVSRRSERSDRTATRSALIWWPRAPSLPCLAPKHQRRSKRTPFLPLDPAARLARLRRIDPYATVLPRHRSDYRRGRRGRSLPRQLKRPPAPMISRRRFGFARSSARARPPSRPVDPPRPLLKSKGARAKSGQPALMRAVRERARFPSHVSLWRGKPRALATAPRHLTLLSLSHHGDRGSPLSFPPCAEPRTAAAAAGPGRRSAGLLVVARRSLLLRVCGVPALRTPINHATTRLEEWR
jgi:hypothetical protein